MENQRNVLRLVLILAVSICGLLEAQTSSAHEPSPAEGLKKILEDSSLVFYGEVSDVQYRLSKDGTPHSFVTYNIKKRLRGSIKARKRQAIKEEQVTLRFVGGPVGNGSFFTADRIPIFNIGDRDVLFVRNNGKAHCPLVYGEHGRFRVFQDRVYNTRGVPVVAVRKGIVIARGRPEPALTRIKFPAPSFDELIKREEVQAKIKKMFPNTSPDELRRKFDEQAPKEIILAPTFHGKESKEQDMSENRQPRESKSAGEVKAITPIDINFFLRTLSSTAESLPAPATPVTSLDPDEAFDFEVLDVSPPKNITEKEAGEIEMLRQQDFNPVLRSRPSVK